MARSPRRTILGGLIALLLATACADNSCGGCAAPLSGPFPAQPRVYDGVQLRLERSAFDFIEANLSDILDSLLADGLQFDIPPQSIDVLVTDVDICQTPCPLQIDIKDAHLSLVPTDTIGFDGHIDVDGSISMDTTIIVPVHCDFPLQIHDKPISAQVVLKVDPDSDFVHFEVTNLDISIESSDYDIQCPVVFDQIMELLKDGLTSILNLAISSQLGSSISDLVKQQTCLPCDFYSGGCPAGSSCNGDGYCEASGNCLIKPQGLVGTLDLGQQLSSVDPTNDAAVDLLVALGQAQQPQQHPFVRSNGLEVRLIGGTYADLDGCLPDPDPQDIPPVGLAPAMNFQGIVPGTGESYMVGVAITDKYLDHFFYQLWRSGLLCLSIDSYGIDQISSGTLALFIPSLNLLTDGENVPVKMRIKPQGVPYIEVGAGTFLADGSIDEPILYVFLPDFRMDFWAKIQGRWELFLSLSQDIRVDLGLEFTADNSVLPILDENSVTVDNVQVSHNELLAEDTDTLKSVVPQLIEMFLPMLTGTMGEIAIPDLQGFVLDIKALEGDLERAGSGYYEFMSIYADLGFSPPPPAVDTRVRIASVGPEGVELTGPGQDLEIQYRVDGGAWSPFKRGASVMVKRWLPPGSHVMDVRARKIGAYRTLDPEPVRLAFDTQPMRLPKARQISPSHRVMRPVTTSASRNQPLASAAEQPRTGCATVTDDSPAFGLIWLLWVGLLWAGLRQKTYK
jgi:hypothetical protein